MAQNSLLTSEYMAVAVALAREAGALARQNFTIGMAREWKEDGSPLTVTDTTINRRVIEEITRQFPTHGVLGEEESALSPDQEWVWVCDPIDGTLPFAHGIPTSAFSLALTRGEEALLGVVYDFHQDRLLTAAKGEGAFLNGKPIQVSSQETLIGGVIGLEAIWTRSVTTPQDLSTLPLHLEPERVKLLKLSSTVYAGMLVGLGELVALISRGDKPWDIAALQVIVTEAGGEVTDLAGKPLHPARPIQGALITNGRVHEQLLQLIASVAGETAPIG